MHPEREEKSMIRKMRRFKQQLSDEAAVELMEKTSWGTLAVVGDDGYPYAVPLSQVWLNGRIYFHGASQGHKFDALLQNPKVSFSVVGQDEVVPEKLTMLYTSAIAFGTARLVEDEDEKRAALVAFADKFGASNGLEKNLEEIERVWKIVRVFAIDVELMTGKASMELKS